MNDCDSHVLRQLRRRELTPPFFPQDPEKPYWVGHLHFFGIGHLEKLLESLDYKILAKSCHDHPHSAGFIMPGATELYDVDKVPVEMDTQESTLESPKAMRILAQKLN